MPLPSPSTTHPPPAPSPSPSPLPLPLPSLPTLTGTPTTHPQSCLSLSLPLLTHLCDSILRGSWSSSASASASAQLVERRGTGKGEGESGKRVRKTAVLSMGSGSGLLEALLLRQLKAELAAVVTSTAAMAAGELGAEGGGGGWRGWREGALGGGGGGGGDNEDDGDRVALGGYRDDGGVGSWVRVYGVEVPSEYTALNRYLPAERRVVVRGVWDVLDRARAVELLERADGEGGNDSKPQGLRGVKMDGGVRSGGGDTGDTVDTIVGMGVGVDVDVGVDVGVGVGMGMSLDVWLMFVYPRQVSLVEKYLDVWLEKREREPDVLAGHGHGHGDSGREGVRGAGQGDGVEGNQARAARAVGMRLIGLVWAGPRADWEDFEAVFVGLKQRGWEVVKAWGGEAGVHKGEGVVVAWKR